MYIYTFLHWGSPKPSVRSLDMYNQSRANLAMTSDGSRVVLRALIEFRMLLTSEYIICI